MRKVLPILFATILALALTTPILGSPALSVVPGESSYQAGETLSVSGSGAGASQPVTIQLYNPSNTRIAIAQGASAADGTYSISDIYTFSSADTLGTYTVKAYCAGEWANATFSLITADATAPVIVSATLSKSVVKGGVAVVVTVNASDNVGVTSVKADTVSLTLVSGAAASGIWNGSITAASAEGAQSVAVKAFDAAGNNVTTTVSYTVDNTAPTITLTAPAAGASFAVSSIIVSGSVSDAVSSAAHITVTVNNVAVTVASDGTFSTSVTLVEGSNTITVKASDEAGNEATATRTVTYTVPTGKVDVSVDVGALYFIDEDAVIWVSTAKDGEAVAATVSGHVILPNGTNVALTFTSVETGIFKATCDVPAEGSYAVVTSAEYQGLHGVGLKSFLVSSTFAGMNAKIIAIKDDVATIKTDAGTIKVDVADIKGNVTAIKDDVAVVKTNVGTLLVDVAAIKGDVVEIKDDVVTVKTNIGTLLLNAVDLNATVIAVKGDVATVKTTVTEIKGTLTTVSGNVATVVTDVGVIKADVKALGVDVNKAISAIGALQTPLWAAVVLSLVAAIAAVAAVISIRSKIAG